MSLLTLAELNAECPAPPLRLAVAPVMMMVPSPRLTIWRETSRLNRKADRVAISHTFNTPDTSQWWTRNQPEYLRVDSGRCIKNRNFSYICSDVVNSTFNRTDISLDLRDILIRA